MPTLCRAALLLGALLLFGPQACTDTTRPPRRDAAPSDWHVRPDQDLTCTPGQDRDQDAIPDEVEGCDGRDRDGDQTPDYLDKDADGDGRPDWIEAGDAPKTPRDTDGDQTPDHLDLDSDGDGLGDGAEDQNGDGLLGCCRKTCGQSIVGCPAVKADACGPGQSCSGNTCGPAVHFLCADGETDPLKADTFGDGAGDKAQLSFVCRASRDDVQTAGGFAVRHNKTGDWAVALPPGHTYQELRISGAKPMEAAAAVGLREGGKQTAAGFLLSRRDQSGDHTQLAGTVASTLIALINKDKSRKVLELRDGRTSTSHDGYPMRVESRLRLILAQGTTLGALRDELLLALLGRKAAEVGGLPPNSAEPSVSGEVDIYWQTLLRDDGRFLVMGGVALPIKEWKHPILGDLSNGTNLARAGRRTVVECDPLLLQGKPAADILWVIDASASMGDDLAEVATYSARLFDRAIKGELDFRMGVTPMAHPRTQANQLGWLCTDGSTPPADRFLMPGERQQFARCLATRGGADEEYGLRNAHAAVTGHLPRAEDSPHKIRKGVSLVIIVITDERPATLSDAMGKNPVGLADFVNCKVSQQLEDYLVKDLFKTDLALYGGSSHGGEGKAVMHLIGPLCDSACCDDIGHGYIQVVKQTGGLLADICQPNLGKAMDAIFDDLIVKAPPARLEYTPITASLTLAFRGAQVPRSKGKGFDYHAPSNSLMLFNLGDEKGEKAMAAYRRWWTKAMGPLK